MEPDSPPDRLPFFASGRERFLWICSASIVVAIYATLGLARTFAGALGGAAEVASFLLGMFLVAVTILTVGLNVRPAGVEIGVGVGIFAAYLMVFGRMTYAAERSHLIEYGVLGVFIYAALIERAGHGRRVPVPALLAISATTLLGVVDECIQLLLPSRVFDPMDMLFNFLAAVMAVVAAAALGWARRLTPRSSPAAD